jgi:hypothetical protein
LTAADIESRNRYQGSADPYEANSYGVPTQSTISAYDKAKYQRKIYIPKNKNFNYTGFIIGPKGTNQKRLEEETGCKILVRGKGSQKEGQPAQTDDNDELHVLVTADDQQTLMKGVVEIEKIIFADEETRNELKRFQLNLMAKLKHDEMGGGMSSSLNNNDMDLSLTTPYGPPSSDARTIAVPRVCIGLVIGTPRSPRQRRRDHQTAAGAERRHQSAGGRGQRAGLRVPERLHRGLGPGLRKGWLLTSD